MTISFPLTVNFTVTDAYTTDEVVSENGVVETIRRLSVTLQARRDTEINLSNGQPMASTLVHLSLFPGKKRATDLAPELDESTVGFLIQISESNGEPFIHGSIAWPEDTLPYYILEKNSSRSVRLSLASVTIPRDGDPYFSWQQGRENLISIASFSLSLHVSNEAQQDG